MQKFSKLISLVFHPLFLSFFGLLIVSYRVDYVIVNAKLLNFVSLFSFVFMVAVPAILIFIGLKLRVFESIYFEKKEDRYVPLLIIGISYYLTYYTLNSWRIPGIIQLYLLGSILTVVVAMLVSIVWKISLHTLAIGSLVGILIGVSARLHVDLLFEISTLIILAGIIAGVRLHLQAHTKAQVYIGFMIGFIGMSSLFLLI